ncbi:hypothetical protein J2X68_001245 [Streptomyces sp. 3330]|uniref:hypothetical protein n=1 Tax=Streptomyces sp. 3330 TaxID=2817755 RepID=UPI002864DF15|nr:hypothetical protein [Streptomyces sp. 3330]MDR6974567.1 hypothetical protein [Streptomyces sp. 3330]
MEGPERAEEVVGESGTVEAADTDGADGNHSTDGKSSADSKSSTDGTDSTLGAAGAAGAAGAEAADVADVADVAAAPLPRPRPRRRGRTTAMIAGAAVLGVVAGACAGFLVQADREPTALPPLSQPVIAQGKGEVEPLSAAQDRRVKTDGDLRKLLITRPKGAKDSLFPLGTDGWVDLATYADRYEKPGATFDNLVEDEFRRAAETSWRVGETYNVQIELVQFRQLSSAAAADWADNGHYWAEDEDDTRSWPVPGTGEGNGTAYVHDTPDRKPGYLPLYTAEAHAWRGDIYVEIFVSDSKPISKAKIMDLAQRQVGKL